MEAAGPTIGVAALWESCVQVFEVFMSQLYSMDYEILFVKLGVEHARLLSWGHAVGLNHLSSNADTRLKSAELHIAVVRLLGCIQHVFQDSERLQNTYGLRLSVVTPQEGGFTAAEEPPSQTQSKMIFKVLFKSVYKKLRRVALERQRNTPVIRKSKWTVIDPKKFMALVAEVRGFNDSLVRILEAMPRDIDEPEQVRDLQLLQGATAGEPRHEDISRRVIVRLRLEDLGISERTGLLSGPPSNLAATKGNGEDADEWETVKNADEETPRSGQPTEGEPTEGEPTEGEPTAAEMQRFRQLVDIELYVEKKSSGALILRTTGPVVTPRCSARVRWEGGKSSDDGSDDREKGFVPMLHASFDLYKKKKYTQKWNYEYEYLDSEDCVLLDPESHIKYENVNPGTVTVEGFGLECWDFEGQQPREREIIRVNYSDLPRLSAKRVLRRVNELQTKAARFGWNPDEEELNLKQIVGTLGITYYDPAYEKERNHWIGDLYSVLNRTDIFADFMKEPSVGMQWAVPDSENSIGFLNFLRQVIVAWELATRLKNLENMTWYSGFTARVLINLIISDLWLKHVKLVLQNQTVLIANLKKPETAMEKAQAEEYKKMGDEAWERKEYQAAANLYTEAIKIDLTNAVYRCDRAAAHLGLENWDGAKVDANVATQLDPKYAKAWSRLGMARLKLGHSKWAKEAYEMALRVAGKDATAAMRQDLADAKAKFEETVDAIMAETNKAQAHAMRSDFADEDFDMLGKEPVFHSLIHGQQVEGLLLFAEKIKWPYINEVRDYAEDVYSEFRGGGIIDIHLHDWLFGMVLPGKWFSFKIMTALILCTPSMKDTVGTAHYYDTGFSLPNHSYWRCRTVLGRALGCLPGVQGLCGWIGPCPPVEFEPPPDDPQKPRHVRISARRITPLDHKAVNNYHDKATYIRSDEDINHYVADMQDLSQWIVPEPPVRDISSYQLKSIKLRKLPLDIKVASLAANSMQQFNIENETEYRASLEFTMDDNPNRPVTYKLLTNAVFVTPPPCRPGPKGPHEVHMRELPRYTKNIWSVGQLKNHTPEDDSDMEVADVMIINATGKGAEVLARAWCLERGKNAIIRRAGGPCFACAVRAAGKGGLGLGTMIWVG